MRNHLIFLTACMMLSCVNMQAQKLFGYVLEQNSGKKPVPGVMVKAGFANQTLSTDEGSFTLTFQNAKPGYNAVLTIEKDKWVITEQNRLEVNLPLDPFKHPHTVIMCRSDVWAKQNKNNLALLNNILKTELQKQKSSLNKQSRDYQKTVDSLDEQFVKSQRNLGELTEALSRVNLDEVSETEKAAYAYFAEGKIDECILLRQTLQSEKNLLLAGQRLKQLSETPGEGDSALINITNTIALHRRNLQEEINLAKLQFDWKTAEKKLKFLAENDSTDHENLLRYAEFLQAQNDFNKAQPIFEKALTVYTKLKQENPEAFGPNLANILLHKGTILKEKNQYEAAETVLKEAFGLYKQLATDNPMLYSKALGETLAALAVIHMGKRLYLQSESELKQVLTIYKSIEQTNANLYNAGLAEVKKDLGILYIRTKKLPDAEMVLKEALTIRKNLDNANPLSQEVDIAEIQHQLGYLYLLQKKNDPSKVLLGNALGVYKKYQQTSPDVYEPLVAAVQINLGSLYTDQSYLGTYFVHKKDSIDARASFNEALDIFKRLTMFLPDVYEPSLAEAYNQVGNFFNEAQDNDSTEAFFTAAISIYEKFAKQSPDVFELPLAEIQQKLGKIYLLHNPTSAKVLFNKSIDIYRHQAGINKEQDLEDEIASCLYDIAVAGYYAREFYSKQENENSIKQYLQQFKTVLETYNALDKKNPGTQVENIKSVKNFIAQMNEELKRVQTLDPSIYPEITEAERAERELTGIGIDIQSAATLYDKLILQQVLVDKKSAYIKKGLFTDVNSFGQDLNGLAWYLLFSRDYAGAEQAARQALSPGVKKTESYDQEMEYANANLAVSLVLQNKFEAAKKIYLSLKGKTYQNETTYVSMFLDDIAQLEKAGITHPDFDKVKSLLVD